MKDKLKKFFADFLKGMSNERGGLSLKKLLATGFFWLCCVICIRFTDTTNVTYVLITLTGTILALMGINQLGKQSMKKIDYDTDTMDPKPEDEPTEDAEDLIGKK